MPTIISIEWPPNIEAIRRVLNLQGKEIFCYGNIIYNPDNVDITSDLIAHEQIHTQQQGDKVEAWWELYLKDKLFRASQEIPAHQVQYKVAKRIIKDRNRLSLYLRQLALNLSGETYGKVLTYSEAMRAIQAEELFDVRKLSSVNSS